MTERIVFDNIVLEPLKDKEYFLSLALAVDKHGVTRETLSQMFDNHGKEFWVVSVDDIQRGIVGYFEYDNVFILEALRDPQTKDLGISNSVKIGKRIIEYLSIHPNKIGAFAREQDKGIQRLCERIGLKKFMVKEGFVVYEKER